MHPICFYIANRPIHWYGVMMAAAFLAGVFHMRRLGRREEGRDATFCADLAFWLMIAGIIGARIGYVLGNLGDYRDNPWTVLRIDQGGLVYYGGFLGAGVAIVVFARLRGQRLLSLLDFIITALPLGHALGRIGCFLNGCCYGRPTDLPWAVTLEGAPRHPVQLYEVACNVVLYLLLLAVYRRHRRDGQVLAAYLLGYPAVRFVLEFFRGDDSIRGGGLTLVQWASIAFFLVGAVLRWRTRIPDDHAQSHPA